MPYPGSDRSNWGSDRKRRIGLFDKLTASHSGSSGTGASGTDRLEEKPLLKKFNLIIPILGAILKLIVFIVIFYAFAMIISHGKQWPE